MAPLLPPAGRLARLVAGPEADADLLRRYAGAGDAAAFAALVDRHGPMVLAVCRRAAGDAHAAEDAFQATFLVLARKAAAVRSAGALPAWLFSTARRLAARARSARDAVIPAADGPARGPGPLDRLSARELLGVLDAEVARLQAHHRSAVLLCLVDGLTVAAAARQLGVAPGAVRGWLQRGRDRLRRRLAGRGLAPSALLALAAASGEVPARALATAAGGLASPLVSAPAPVAALAAGSRGSGVAAGLLTAVALAGLGLALGGPPPAPPPPSKDPAPPPTAPRPADPPTGLRYAGVVLDADGKPVAGATVHLSGLQPGVIEFKPRAKSGPDGRFEFTVRPDEFQPGRPEDKPGSRVFLGATAVDHGSVAAAAVKPDERERLSLRLPAERPATGRVIDTQGRPVAGVSVGVSLRAGKLDRTGKPVPFDDPGEDSRWLPNLSPLPDQGPAVSDKDGRVTVRGVSADWLYDLYVRGPGIVMMRAELVARPQKDEVASGTGLHDPARGAPRLVRHGSTFTLVVVPARVVTGVVREKGTGRPIAGVSVGRPFVADPDPPLWTKTGNDGRFRLDGMARGRHELRVDPAADQPYLETRFPVDTAADPAAGPVECAFELARQRMVVGRVVDRTTGRGVAATVECRPTAGNPALTDAPDLAAPRWNLHPAVARSGADGRFAIRALPGPAVLLVRADGAYRPAASPDPTKVPRAAGDAELLDVRPHPAVAGDFHAAVPVEVAGGGPDTAAEVEVDAGRSVGLEVRYPGGTPRETWVLGRAPPAHDRVREYDPAADRVAGLAAGEARRVYAVTRDHALAGHAVLDGRADGPAVVTLRPTGAVAGRVVGPAGDPLPGQAFQLYYDDGPGRGGVYVNWGFSHRLPTEAEAERRRRTDRYARDRFGGFSMSVHTDAGGRFRIEGLIPDLPFDLWVVRIEPPPGAKPGGRGGRILGYERATRVTVGPGRTKDLGDLKLAK